MSKIPPTTIGPLSPSGSTGPQDDIPSNPLASSTTSTPSQEPRWSVESALSSLGITPPSPSSPSPPSPIPTLHLLERLKTTPREGWRRFKVPHPESIADHMYRMSIITLLAPTSIRSTIDIAKATRLALVHDMAEAVVGDITPPDGVPKEEKSRRERDTMTYLATSMLGRYEDGRPGQGLRELWEEYEAGVTPEARFVKDVDKLELLCQMVEYEKASPEAVQNGERDLSEFMRSAMDIKGEEMRRWAEELIAERDRYWRGLGKVPRSASDNKDGKGAVAKEGEGVSEQKD